jgi:hypothetical protein
MVEAQKESYLRGGPRAQTHYTTSFSEVKSGEEDSPVAPENRTHLDTVGQGEQTPSFSPLNHYGHSSNIPTSICLVSHNVLGAGTALGQTQQIHDEAAQCKSDDCDYRNQQPLSTCASCARWLTSRRRVRYVWLDRNRCQLLSSLADLRTQSRIVRVDVA